MSPIEIVSIVSAFGVIGALIFNGLTHLKYKKDMHYQALKDLEEEYTKIQQEYPKIVKWDGEHSSKIRMTESNDNFVAVTMYRWKFIQFHEKVAHLAIRKIISKDIARYFRTTFPEALRYVELSLNSEKIESASNFLYQWCKQEKIQPKNDS